MEVKYKMSALQLGLLIVTTCYGAQIVLSPSKVIEQAGNGTLVYVVLAGLVYCSAALMMLKLGQLFPGETFVEYMPRLWGPVLGTIVLWWFMAMLFLVLVEILGGFSQAVAIFMFDRTPPEVIGLGLLITAAYCAMQSFGTMLRLHQLLFFVALVTFLLSWPIGLLNVQTVFLQPVWPENWSKTGRVLFEEFDMYNGYEIILLLLPLVYRGKVSLAKTIIGAFGLLTTIFFIAFAIIIGVMSVKAAANTPYPTVIVMRAVELPGTFIERIENYVLLAWIPTVYDTFAMLLYVIASMLAQKYRYADHAPLVLVLTPLIFAGVMLLSGFKSYELIDQVTNWMGILFSFAIIPLSLALAWRQKQVISGETKKC